MKKITLVCLTVSVGLVCGGLHRSTEAITKDAIETIEESSTQSEKPIDGRSFYTLDSGEVLPINGPISCGMSPRSFRELVEMAEVIVIGEPIESIEESEVFSQNSYNAFSVTEFKIEKAIKGSFEDGNTLRLAQSAAILSNSNFEFPDNVEFSPEVEFSKERDLWISTAESYRPVRKGTKYILFLGEGLAEATGAYFPAGMEGGRYSVDGTDALKYEDPAQDKIRDYAIALHKAVVEDPDRDHLSEIVKLSDKDFEIVQ